MPIKRYSGPVGALVLSGSFLTATLFTAACHGGFEALSFSELSPAATDAEKRSVRASDTVLIDQRIAKIGFTTILRSGQSAGDAPNHVFGELVDDSGKPLLREDASRPIADSNDFSSLIKQGGKLFSVAQFESIPAAMYLTELAQDGATGALSAVATHALDLAPIHGLWNPCAGMVTPWNTHLGSEEYEPDAKKGATSAAGMAPFFGGGQTLNGDATKPNPYFYGFPVEVSLGSSGQATVVKHYSLGRFAHELSFVLPDRKTVYQADDGTNVAFFMYVADAAGDLTAGNLYALKWQQTSIAGASELGAANISWIKLGHASDDDISTLIDSGLTFADLFDSATPTDGICPDGFHSVSANGIGQECLALKSGKEQAAAFLESRRYAGYLGATTELRKEEGIAFDPDTNRLYVAYSELQYGMEDAKKNGTANTTYDLGTSNDVKLGFNSCGGVYAYELGRDAAIGSSYVAKRVQGVVAGRMTTVIDPDKLNPTTLDAYAADSPFLGSTCDIEGLANPDNISFVTGRKTLLIGEDSGDGHQNDMVWSYNVETRELTRIETTPYGAETTSVYYHRNLNGFGYIVSVVQHPYGESDQTKLSDPGDKHSYFGYIGPLPVPDDRR
jgi:hypothetical protein